MNKTDFLPSLPLRDIVVFPGMIVPLFVGRDKSINALNEVMKTNKKIILVTQKNAEIDDPVEENLYQLYILVFLLYRFLPLKLLLFHQVVLITVIFYFQSPWNEDLHL